MRVGRPGSILLTLFFLKDVIYSFLERGEEEKERERNMCEIDLLPLTRPQLGTCNPGMCRDWESNLQPSSLQAGAQSTEPYQPGLTLLL